MLLFSVCCIWSTVWLLCQAGELCCTNRAESWCHHLWWQNWGESKVCKDILEWSLQQPPSPLSSLCTSFHPASFDHSMADVTVLDRDQSSTHPKVTQQCAIVSCWKSSLFKCKFSHCAQVICKVDQSQEIISTTVSSDVFTIHRCTANLNSTFAVYKHTYNSRLVWVVEVFQWGNVYCCSIHALLSTQNTIILWSTVICPLYITWWCCNTE